MPPIRQTLTQIRREADALLGLSPLDPHAVQRGAERIAALCKAALDSLEPVLPPATPPTHHTQSGETSAGTYFERGQQQLDAGAWDAAEISLRESVRLHAGSPAALIALARALLGNPRYERAGTLPVARSLVERAVALAPDDAAIAAFHASLQNEMGG